MSADLIGAKAVEEIASTLGVVEEIDFHSMPVNRWDPTLSFFATGYRITTMGIRFFENCVGELPKQNLRYDLDEDSDGSSFSDIIRIRDT